MSDFDTLLQIAALALGSGAIGYVAKWYYGRIALAATAALVTVVQRIRAAKTDGIFTVEEKVAIADAVIALEAGLATAVSQR